MKPTPYMYWVGVNLPADITPAEEQEFNDFYTNVHMPEVVGLNDGFVRAARYQLTHPDPRGDFGPRYLAIYEMDSEEAALGYIKRNDTGFRQPFTPGPRGFKEMQGMWRLMWGRLTPQEGGLGAEAPYLNFIAMNPPAGVDQVSLAQFNEFYNNTHIPEIVGLSKFMRGTRYELFREFRHPVPGSPRYLAVYEGDEQTLEARKQREANPGGAPAWTQGPPSFGARDTLWRLGYERVAAHEK